MFLVLLGFSGWYWSVDGFAWGRVFVDAPGGRGVLLNTPAPGCSLRFSRITGVPGSGYAEPGQL